MGGAATFDAALLRAEKTTAFIDSSNTYVQAGEQGHTGIELMAKGRCWRPLEVSAGLTYIDAELKDDPATAGNRPVNVPRLSAVLFGDYALAAVPGLRLSGQVNDSSSRDYRLPNKNEVGGCSVLGAGARCVIRIADRRSVFSLNVDNVHYKAHYKIDSLGATPGAPRTVKASLEVQLR